MTRPQTTNSPLIHPHQITRRTALRKLATMAGTATVGAAALQTGLILPAQASGISTNCTPAGTLYEGPGGTTFYMMTGTDGQLYWKFTDFGPGWTPFPGGMSTPSAPAAVAVGAYQGSYVFAAVRGYNNYIYVNQGTPGGSWIGWQSDFAMQTDVAPSITASGNQVFLLAKRTDGRIFYNTWVLGGGAVGWQEVGSGGSTTATPVAAVAQNYMFVMVRGGDGYLHLNQGTPGGSWVGWQTDYSMVTAVGPALTATDGNTFYLFATGSGGQIYASSWTLGGGRGGWIPTYNTTHPTNLAPSAVVNAYPSGVTTAQPLITSTDSQVYRTQVYIGFNSSSSGWEPV